MSSPDQDVRQRYLPKILSGLTNLKAKLGTPDAEGVADGLLSTMKEFGEELPTDPLVEVVMALHDSFASENLWKKYTAAQYQLAYDVLYPLSKDPSRVTSEIAEKSIGELEKGGIDTTPIELPHFKED